MKNGFWNHYLQPCRHVATIRYNIFFDWNRLLFGAREPNGSVKKKRTEENEILFHLSASVACESWHYYIMAFPGVELRVGITLSRWWSYALLDCFTQTHAQSHTCRVAGNSHRRILYHFLMFWWSQSDYILEIVRKLGETNNIWIPGMCVRNQFQNFLRNKNACATWLEIQRINFCLRSNSNDIAASIEFVLTVGTSQPFTDEFRFQKYHIFIGLSRHKLTAHLAGSGRPFWNFRNFSTFKGEHFPMEIRFPTWVSLTVRSITSSDGMSLPLRIFLYLTSLITLQTAEPTHRCDIYCLLSFLSLNFCTSWVGVDELMRNLLVFDWYLWISKDHQSLTVA